MIILLLIFPLAELYAWYLFIDRYSFVDALLLIFTGGGLGLLVMKTQGKAALLGIQASLAQGKVPTDIFFHRGLIMLGGLFIFLPGLVSKIVGTLFIMPGFRHIVVLYFRWYFARKIALGAMNVFSGGSGFQFGVFSAGGMGPGSPFGGLTRERDVKETPASRDVIDIRPLKIEKKE